MYVAWSHTFVSLIGCLTFLSMSQAVAAHTSTYFFPCLCKITDVLEYIFSGSIMGKTGVRFVFDNHQDRKHPRTYSSGVPEAATTLGLPVHCWAEGRSDTGASRLSTDLCGGPSAPDQPAQSRRTPLSAIRPSAQLRVGMAVTCHT